MQKPSPPISKLVLTGLLLYVVLRIPAFSAATERTEVNDQAGLSEAGIGKYFCSTDALTKEQSCPFIRPHATDPRCRNFGFRQSSTRAIPIAWPLIMDLTEYGTLTGEAIKLSDKMAESLNMTGIFSVNNRDMAPAGGAISWISPVAFDYLGWRSAGNWMVITGTISPLEKKDFSDNQVNDSRWVDGAGDGGDSHASRKTGNDYRMRVTVSLTAYLTEEGNHLAVAESTATMELRHIYSFGSSFVDVVAECISGIRSSSDTRIVYARKKGRTGKKEIWITNLGSGIQKQLSDDGALAMLPAWGPGGRVAWTGYRRGNPDIYLEGKLFGKRDGMNTGIAWAPDGTSAALTWAPESAPDIYLINPSTGKIGANLTKSPAIDASPAWSPDSRRIAFVSDRNGTPNIFVMDRDGSNVSALPLAGEYNTGPDWSPDGRSIAYQSRGAGSRFSIWIYDVNSRTSRKVSRGGRNDEEPSWSPDGKFIVYTSTWDGIKKLYIMNNDGSGAHPVFKDDAEYFTPSWERSVGTK